MVIMMMIVMMFTYPKSPCPVNIQVSTTSGILYDELTAEMGQVRLVGIACCCDSAFSESDYAASTSWHPKEPPRAHVIILFTALPN